MSRRNSSTRRRSYGRRLHEINQRRPARQTGLDWIDEIDSSAAEQLGDTGASAMLGRRPLPGGPEEARP